jgi:putative transposase
MSSAEHVFHEIFLHINWHCHDDLPLITSEMKVPLRAVIEQYCRKFRGVHFKRFDGTATHVHLAIQVEPTVSASDFVGKVKGFSSYEINKMIGAKALRWQKGYGVVSFAKRNLKAVCHYIDKQEGHHGRGTANETLERVFVDAEEGVYEEGKASDVAG